MRRILLSLLILYGGAAQAIVFTWNGNGDGLNWEDKNNWDLVAVPGGSVTHEVIIDTKNEVQLSSSKTIGKLLIANCKFTIRPAANLTVSYQGPLSVNTVYATELLGATVNIAGTFLLKSTEDDYALAVTGSSFNVQNGGYFKIIYTDFGVLVGQNGYFSVGNTGFAELIVDSTGIQNENQVFNNGKLQINYGIDGFLNNGRLINQDSLILEGTSLTAQRGLVNTDSVHNQSVILIQNNELFGMHNTGQVVNASTGYLEVYRYAGNPSIAGSESIHNEGLFQNEGTLYLNSFLKFGIYNLNNVAGFINSGTTTVGTADSLGFVNSGNGADSSLLVNTGRMNLHGNHNALFTNSFSKVLWQGKGLLTGLHVLDNQGFMELTDSLKIEASGTGLINSGKLKVIGPLELVQYTYGIDNQSEMEVTAAGRIKTGLMLTNLNSYALKNSADFVNDGTIDITHGIRGIVNESSQGFTNSGMINIHNLGLIFLDNSGVADSSYFTNNGSINIGNSVSASPGPVIAGLYNQVKGKFINDGSLSFSQLFYGFDALTNAGVFLQHGQIAMDHTEELLLENSGQFTAFPGSSITAECSSNWNQYAIHNTGNLLLDGQNELIYDDTYARNPPLVQNDATMNCRGRLEIHANGASSAIGNTDQCTITDSLIMSNVRNYIFNNTGDILIEPSAFVQVDTSSSSAAGSILIGQSFVNQGYMVLNVPANVFKLQAGQTLDNQGEIRLNNGQAAALIQLSDPTAQLLNSGKIEINGSQASGLVDPGTVLVTNGQINNQGTFRISGTADPAIRMQAGSFINDDTLDVSSAASLQMIYLNAGQFTNNGVFELSGAGENNVHLLLAKSGFTLSNNGQIEITDAYNMGLKIEGPMTTTVNSDIRFSNNTRNTGTLFHHSYGTTPVTYYGQMYTDNSQNCVFFDGAAVNNGYLNLAACGINMLNGTNAAGGHIISRDLSLIGINDGIIEYTGSEAYVLNGTDLLVNNALIIDRNDGFRNIRFHDGGALGYPVWNKGLFISPFYGSHSDGIKETINLNYTEAGTLPLSTSWWTNRTKTTVAGSWDQTGHFFTPNASANAADSLFLEINLTGTNAVLLAIPHRTPILCPQPVVTRNLQPVVDKNWIKHSTWRGNRAPDYCNKVTLSGQEDLYVPAGYRAEVNTLEFIPGLGSGRYLEIQDGAVFEVNVVGFE